MKYRWNPALRPFAILAALAMFALPARADTLSYSVASPHTIRTGVDASTGKARQWWFSVYREDVSTAATIATESSDPTVVKIGPSTNLDVDQAQNRATVRLAKETTRVDGEDTANFFLVAVKPGEADITASIQGDNATAAVTFHVVVEGVDTSTLINLTPSRVDIDEGSNTTIRVTLGSPAPANTVLNLAVEGEGNPADHVSLNRNTILITAGNSTGSFRINGLDGDYTFSVVVSDPSGVYTNATLDDAMINNVSPVLHTPDPEREEPYEITALMGAPYLFTASASDVSADDEANLVYHWTGSTSTTSRASITVNSEGEIIEVFATDNNGGRSKTGKFVVTLADSARLTFTDVCLITPITVRGGNGAADFVINPFKQPPTDDASNPWNEEAGNDFYSPGGGKVQPILAPGTYPFGWQFPEDQLSLADPSVLVIPNPDAGPIDVKSPEPGGRATIRYFSSKPFYPFDDFGDFDQDGLSDDWESHYLDAGKPTSERTFSNWPNLAVTVPTGLYGPSGTYWDGRDGEGTWNNMYDTPDNDRIPTRLYEEIENVWKEDPHYDPTDGMINLVRVFQYPLTGDYVDYGTHVGYESGRTLRTISGIMSYDSINHQSTSTKPFFSNILEFRGLPQSASADKDHPNWRQYGYPGVLGSFSGIVDATQRGNCPVTDPTVADTDGDIFEDGWEYYFWTTVLYENSSENWRAFDPTFTLYPNLAPGGSADFKATGLPLLRKQLEGYEAEYDGGLFVRYPAQTFQPELIRDECYYGSPNLDPTTRSSDKNSLTNTPIGSVAYYDDPAAEEPTPAVVFMMGGLEIYTRDGHVDALGRAKLFYKPRQTVDYEDMSGPHPDYNGQEGVYPSTMIGELEPGEISGAYVDFLSGQFFLPGYDYFPEDIRAIIGARDAELTVSYRTVNGLFPKSWLLSQFDPFDPMVGLWNDKWEGYPDFAAILGALGIDGGQWDCVSDLDGDGLSNYEEYFLGTNPMHWDTDNDGLPDGWEILFELDPHNPRDASENPDCDYMYTSGGYRHCDAFLYDYFNDTFWNGQTSLGFLPGAGAHSSPAGNFNIPFTSREEFYVQKWMIGKDDSGNYPMFVNAVYPSMWWDYGRMQPIKSLNPRSDDSNSDHIPDGWALYAGYKPAGSIDLIDHVWAPFFALPMFCPSGLRPDPDDKKGDGLGWLQEFENWTMFNTRSNQVHALNPVYVETEQMAGHYHDENWYRPQAANWTNKKYPTDPWHGDTDGDGISDAGEYQESGGDNNGDGQTLLNFNPCSADTRLNRLGDAWNYASGLYDTVNAARADLQGELGPYGDPDGDGLPNYQEYLTTAVYGWRYDYWYSPDNRELWVPFGEYQPPYSMKDEDLSSQIAADPYIAANYSIDPIVRNGAAVMRLYDVCDTLDPPVPMPEDAYPYGKSVHFQPYRASDFFRGRPSSKRINDIISTVIRLEHRWTNSITHTFHVLGDPQFLPNGDPNIIEVPLTAEGWDETFSPTLHDLEKADADPLFKVSVIANYMQRIYALTHDRLGRFMLEEDPVTGELKPTAFISLEEFYTLYNGYPSAECDLRDYMFSYGIYPAPWEPKNVQIVDDAVPVLWAFAPPGSPFPSCLPRDPDSDHDGMDDYWEVYHGLNPLYGGSPVAGKAGSYPEQDRADKHPDGLGSVRDWYMQPDPRYVRVLTAGYAVSREPRAFFNMMVGYEMEAAHFDYKTRPWLAGDRFADPDQDGLCNQEESYNYLLNDVLHHTDPSPYWFTDPSYAESYVNLYYKVDGELGVTYWWWDKDLLDTDGDGPTYLFDFEINEGFDTDNDNIADSIELTQDDNNGVTDPLDLDSPRKRKALYFDGHAAARTRNPYYHDKFSLTSYTVEFWVRPERLPEPGKRMTLVQRPVLMPVDDSSGATHWDIRNTFLLQLDELGRVCARVDNDARETVASATVVSAGRLVPNKWAHIALTMDSVDDRFVLYINGEYAAGVGAGLKPCTGGLFGFQYQSPVGMLGQWESANLYDYSPSPIVLGAFDRNPWGVVGGNYETYPWGTMNRGRSSIAGQSEPDFDPEQYFVGWMDEIRIWDRCRSQSEIKNNMTKRFTKEDIEAINRQRLAWELQGWDEKDPETDRVGDNFVSATAQSPFPQRLLYHYAFDNLPDVMPARDRDTSFMDFFTADADPFPAGWQSDAVSAYRPNPFWTAPMWYHYRSLQFPHLVPWWYAAQHRSTIYTDYSYVPWIENTVAHMPQTPALDMKGLFPNWNTATWTVDSYRYRAPMDWMSDALGPTDFVPHRQDDVVPAALPATGSTDVTLDRIRNSMNPYVMFYRTAITIADEIAPNQFAGKLDRYGRYTGIPVLSDMLPLMDAVADIDVPMWDGKGRGTELAAVDTDGDGLPDWWEIVHGLDPNDESGVNGAYGDSDSDGLDNWAEYLAHTDPFRYDTDHDGYSDYYSRPDAQSLTYGEMYDDGDGMDNVWEIENGLDPNRYDATDDADGDGWTNWEEFMSGTNPNNGSSVPSPEFSVIFDYNGNVSDTANLVVLSYGERTAGPNMGGAYDGRFSTVPNWSFPRRLLGEDGKGKVAGGEWNVNYLSLGHIVSATMDISMVVNGTNTTVSLPLQRWNDEYGMFLYDITGIIGMEFESGTVFCSDDYLGTPYQLSVTIDGYTFPFTYSRMLRASGTHLNSGYNRFLGFIDVNGNGELDIGEPMGLSQPRPTLVSWDAVEAEIPLSDSVWGYPRIHWDAPDGLTNGVSASDIVYFVTFEWERGASLRADTATTGDFDSDGLEDWMEALAGTDPNSTNGVPNDYYSIDPATGFFWGELLDDGDGVSSSWELRYGLDPQRYDGTEDLDDDGWSNYAEFMAGTDPTDADKFPEPSLDVTFRYTGAVNGSSVLKVQSYGELLHGRYPGANGQATVNMAGSGDGLFTSSTKLVGSFGMPYYSGGVIHYFAVMAMGVTFDVSDTGAAGIRSATLSFYRDGQLATYELQEFNEDYGYFVDDEKDHIFFEYETGYMLSRSGETLTEDDELRGRWYTFEYTPAAKAYPFTVKSMTRVTEGYHMVEGRNRFLGFMDLNSDGTWDEGEPMGLSPEGATLVGWDSTATEINLTDSVWDYPRISWEAEAAAAEAPADGAWYVTFAWDRGVSSQGGVASYSAITGDSDGDGLEDWMEALAGTDPNSPATDPNDYFLPDAASGLFFGERYDDGDGLPSAWEMRYGLDPYRFDAQRDLDDDGWSNWAEFMGGTDPSNPDDYPEPALDVVFRYTGKVDGVSALKVLAYGSSVHGLYPGRAGAEPIAGSVVMGGLQDGIYTTLDTTVGLWNDNGPITALDTQWGTTFIGVKNISAATLLVYRDGEQVEYAAVPFYENDDYGVFVDDADARIFVEWASGLVMTQFYSDTQDADSLIDESGLIVKLGRSDHFSPSYRITFTTASESFPMRIGSLARDRSNGGGHMVEGPNRFLGLMDLNGNGTWDRGEPMGLSLGGATEVGWESAAAEIPLTDSLWGFPRVSWPAADFENPIYYVTFNWVRGGSQGTETEAATTYYGVTGDWDGDGLEDWMEAFAGTDTNSVAGDPNDYFAIDPATGFSFGERYDDGDGMPTAWEIRYGLDPYRYDGNVDTDDDGWSNWAEFMAGTDPSAKDSYPKPKFSATFYYDGTETDLASVGVYAYGEKTQGGAWGGSFDGRYTSTKGFGYGKVLGSDGTVTLDQYSDAGASGTFNVTRLDHGLIESAAINVYVEGTDGTTEVRSFAMTQINPGMGVFTQDDMGWILIEIESGRVLVYGDYVGKTADIQTTVRSYSFPVTFSNLIRNPYGNHTHMVEGPNRFFGWMDLDGNETYDQGEPMGLGLHAPSLVGWDSASVEIPLTDSRWDYPRISWTMPTNATGFGATTYYVNFSWVRGASTRTDTEAGATYYSTTGDWDGDGLEDWMEALAGTATNSVAGVDPTDYYRLSNGNKGLSYGEIYDDGDGMPTAWELRYGLNPYRYDAPGDADDDGWSNYSEFMAGTDPTSASDYPRPRLSATFYYCGRETDLVSLGIYTYGEKTQGGTWGGPYDGRYTSTKGFSDGVYLGSDGTITLDEYSDAGAQGTFAVNKLRHGLIESASIDVYVEGDDGATEVRSFQMQQINPGMGLFTQDDMGWILISIESGQVLTYGDYVGKVADVHTVVKTYTFPVTFTSLIRNPEGNHTHMVEGPNRFFGWMDLDGNETYDQGEPMGLGLYTPTLVGWDSTAVEVPLTDTLWDYPRVSWNDFVPTNFVPTDYLVHFSPKGRVISGSVTNDLGDKLNISYGDEDGDGLDIWMETKSRTNVKLRDPDPAAAYDDYEAANDVTGRLQYDWVDDGKVIDSAGRLTFGESLDDTDGMPAQWELTYGLDPNLFDADSDLDDDGWSNYAEFLADTDPSDPDDYPEPQFDVTFRYDGEIDGASTLKVAAYSERRHGTHLVESNPRTLYMGGLPDGLYTTKAKSFGYFADAGEGDIEGVEFGLSRSGGERIGSATLTVTANVSADAEGENALASQIAYTLQPYSDDFGVFINDGSAFVLLEYSTGIIYSRFTYLETQTTTSSNQTTTATLEKTAYDKSPSLSGRYTIEYSSSTTHYPFTVRGLQAVDPSENAGDYPTHDHMVEGYNRFVGWMDLNGDDTWNPGEPMGLSLYDATLVGWDSVATEIPLTDELFGFPRLAWDPATNMTDVTAYRVMLKRGTTAIGPTTGIRVEAPRTFLHEGDYIENSMRGVPLGSSESAVYSFTVIALNDADISKQVVVTNGEFRLNAQEVLPSVDGTRRAVSAIYPKGETLRDPLVELRWNMDWRTEGVTLVVKKGGTTVINEYVPFPVRHGRITDDDYYYSYIPQLKKGRSLVALDAGDYTWTVTEALRLDGYTPSSSSGSFSIKTGWSSTRGVAPISGHVHYYGRLANANGVFNAGKVVILAYRVSDRASSSLNVSGQPVAKVTLDGAGAFTVPNLEPGSYGLVAFVDANGNGLPDVGETQGMAFSGGTADPIQLSEWFKPLRIAVKDGAAVPVEDVHIVLRDRDLNGDKVPEIYSDTLANYRNLDVVTVPAAKPAEGPGTNWVSTAVFDAKFRPYTSRENKKVEKTEDVDPRTVPEVTVHVKGPRTFLHEGDLADTLDDGRPTYGFDLGPANAVDYTWEVVATDGYHYQTNAGGSFFVYAGDVPENGGDRRAIEPRWPIQNTVVHGSTVQFEWTMDDRNAGVSFLIKGVTDATFSTNIVVPFPVRHWDTEVECYYYTAVPQMQDGLRLLSLPDGEYEYTITERPRTAYLPARKTRTERFQIRNADNSRISGSIEGNVWYYGRSTQPNTNPPRWKNDLRIQAYKVADTATSSASVGGLLVAETRQKTNGPFRIAGLAAGTYSVFAFVDSNGNGVADEWETQGVGVFGGNASPVIVPATASPIVVTNGAFVTQVNIVLHDRDTDSDLLPDVWEYEKYGNLVDHNGYEAGPSNTYANLRIPDPTILTNWSWKATNIVTRQVDIPQTDGLRVRIDGPREFLHEGDLVTPYILRDRSSGARDEDSNRTYYLWKRAENVDGTFFWQPLAQPYYGFYLGSYSNAVVNYTVEVWNGMDSAELAKGSLRVVSVVGDGRLPMTPRWPTQMAQVHGSPVRFEWNMDDHNAGVLFSLKNLDTGEMVFEDLVVPFPVRHWDPTVKCYYYTAEPQMEGGLRFVDLPAGAYEYTIVERPQTDLVEPERIVERFQLVKGDPTLTTATLSGDIWYYGRAMEPGNPPTWASPLHVQAYEVSDAAVSSASVGGRLVADGVQNENGPFRIDGLAAGTYTVFAFVDSNGNGIADDWETQGIGVYGGNASPVLVAASASPIVATNGAFVDQINIVLHDRDTDSDLLPDVWEWETYGSLTEHNGYEAGPSNSYTSLTIPDPTILTNWSWKATNVVTRLVDIPEMAGLRVRIDEPRTFLHEGDLLAPYELKDRTPGGADTPDNREYRLWTLETSGLDGMQMWVPLDTPYYGFVLGSYTNIDVSWTAEATDGVGTTLLAEDEFRVMAAPDAEYDHAAARYPVQNEKVRTSVVQFEWLMDDRTAGVDFRLWKVPGPTDGVEGLDPVVSMTIPLPVRHWDADERCYYWTARPQQEDGLRFLDLEDGFYVYEIRTRPQTSSLIARPRTITERFQMAKGEPSRVTGSIAGTIRYFGRAMDAGAPPTWPADLHLQARRVGASSATSASVGGEIVSDEVRSENGDFLVSGLAAGTYTVFAFVDSNGNGVADDWETQGYGVFGGTASPVVVPGSAPPIVVTNGAAVTDVNVVLHDRDTDDDLLPDAWEWNYAGSLSAVNGYQEAASNAYVSLTWSEGDPTDWAWEIDWTQVIRRAAATAVKEALRVRVDAPRTFLHEGDFLAPYILRDASPDATDEPANRLYRLWLGSETEGVETWIPQTEPYLGFDLGSHSNIVVTWKVEASNGAGTTEIANGSFPVRTEVGEARMPATPRYPVQNEKVRASAVEFQWTMDECNAGVVFDVWKVSGPEGTKDDADAVQVLADRIVALPVRHWDAAKRSYYWTARPQQTEGTAFVPFEDGFYVYEITTRPRTDLVEPEKISGRFQMGRSAASPTTASIEGVIRYFGRAMEPGDPPTWPADLHLQAWKVSSSASSSASAGGSVWSDEIRSTNGAFRVSGLPAGTYAIVAFVDSNGNGVADDWETQGFGMFGGSASPVVVGSTAFPISVTNGQALAGVNVVLHDRDTDNDLLPDVWEWTTYASLSLHNGYEAGPSNDYVSLTWSDPDGRTDWIWPNLSDAAVVNATPEIESIRVRVDGPRTFLHEGDFMMPYVYGTRLSGLRALGYYAANGMPSWSDLATNDVNAASFLGDDRNRVAYLWRKRKEDSPWEALTAPYYGFWLGSSSNVLVKWSVEAWDGADTTNVADGSFHVISATGAQRKRLASRYPTQQTEIFGNVVEFEWEMDDHNAGVYFTLRKIAGEGVTNGVPVTVISNMVVAIPIRHGRDGVDGAYYSAVPQLDGGALYAGRIEGEPDFDRLKWTWTPDNGKTFVALPGDGLYEYWITERPQSDSVVPQTIVERFRLANDEATRRGLYDVSGSIRYYGKAMEVVPVDGVDFAPNATRTVWTATAPADSIVRGATSVLVTVGDDTVEAFSDSQANGVLYASGGTNATAWSGTIDYETGEIEILFTRGLAADRTLSLAVKSFPAPLYLQAFRLPDDATTCVSVSGTPVYQEVRRAKGDFTVRNLERGKYAIRAFLDSNGNGYADEWETQGLAVMTGTVSPNIDPSAAPIDVRDNVTGLMIILHDRDTDNDLLPDAWEWWKSGGSLLTSGYDVDEGGLEWWRQYADGILDSDPRTPDTDLDGLTDAMEILVTQTDTHLKDTDGDGLGDLEEFLSGSDPNSAKIAIPYTIPALAFDANGVPFVEVSYPALRPGVTLTYELQRKLSLAPDEAWETVAELPVANDGGAVYYSQYDGVNAHISEPGTATMWPLDQAEGVDFSTGFFRIKVYADYGKMVENEDGTCSFMTWVRTGTNSFEYKEAARGKGTLVRDANGNWSFVSSATGLKGALVRDDDGNWSFQE